MDGVTDATMRSLQGELCGFSFVVSEFVRVTREVLPAKVFYRDIPELHQGGCTSTGLASCSTGAVPSSSEQGAPSI